MRNAEIAFSATKLAPDTLAAGVQCRCWHSNAALVPDPPAREARRGEKTVFGHAEVAGSHGSMRQRAGRVKPSCPTNSISDGEPADSGSISNVHHVVTSARQVLEWLPTGLAICAAFLAFDSVACQTSI